VVPVAAIVYLFSVAMLGSGAVVLMWPTWLFCVCLLISPVGLVLVYGVRACLQDDAGSAATITLISGVAAPFPILIAIFDVLHSGDELRLHLHHLLIGIVLSYYLLTTCILHGRLAWLLPRRRARRV